jgi:hypothetical protein
MSSVLESEQYTFKLVDFSVNNGAPKKKDDDDFNPENNFSIQMFGIDEAGKTYSVMVNNFKPFFYANIPETWSLNDKRIFTSNIKKAIGSYYEKYFSNCQFVQKRKLYGYDGGKKYKFVKLEFDNIPTFNKVKNLWYHSYKEGESQRLIQSGYQKTTIYESNIPPILRLFHINDISPSGWVSIFKNKSINTHIKTTTCYVEINCDYKDIISLNDKETLVPYKICSFDIEASSSHGDFPIPVKTYKKTAYAIIEFLNKPNNKTKTITSKLIEDILRSIFRNNTNTNTQQYPYENDFDKVYTKTPPDEMSYNSFLTSKCSSNVIIDKFKELNALEKLFYKDSGETDFENDENEFYQQDQKFNKNYECFNDLNTITDLLNLTEISDEIKIDELVKALHNHFPEIEGDKITFIGSTFLKYGEKEPYYNNCIVLNSCSDVNNEVSNSDDDNKILLAVFISILS